ncbi:hypothetical protein COCSUDRAFT_32042 [Coccomyxa subellipsoidea C-169]|uniref:Secreted protein n=1 Tax=Coccomyxa subellipsoidea (strain C-169) TaxID=574566 RepID=I0ZA92_COCSC|nr:hypothetical protein COCSUDRAFT_32042 [Coccomyxa subellipsoidea C-169]EIE27561.1 hypothetical protein COCSUDRAFT_32042 [Coccomyxa subellipsoidea C-169]|eukprot:XP_005652105.1 hypothetical protein COCSUDRAFT_32042 [Coccomyxa subellipsoidea C-169]
MPRLLAACGCPSCPLLLLFSGTWESVALDPSTLVASLRVGGAGGLMCLAATKPSASCCVGAQSSCSIEVLVGSASKSSVRLRWPAENVNPSPL